jgi:hypothetical protein
MHARAWMVAALLMSLLALVPLGSGRARAQAASFHIVSDGTAKFSYTEEPGWQTLGFDDSAWRFVVAPSAGLCPPAVVPPEETTHPIWGEDPQEFQAIFVRKTFTLDAAATANIIAGADDDYDLFLNGVFIGGNHDGATNLDLYTNVPLQAGLNALAMKAIDVVGGCQWLAFDVFPPPVNDELSGAPEPGTMVYDPTPVPDGPAGTFSFIADFCNIGTKQLTELTSVTTTLTGGNVLLNRDSGTPPDVGSELTFPANRGYADQILDPDECVDVPFTIGLQEPTSFQFFVDVMGAAAEP